MAGKADARTDLLNNGLVFDILQELEAQGRDQLRRLRKHERMHFRTLVTLRPEHAEAAPTLKVQGITGDLSRGGCRAIFPAPIGVGESYRLAFACEPPGLPEVTAQCVRCRMMTDRLFETGFRFTAEIDLTVVPKPAGCPSLK
jgi:hypothetical protein